MIKCGCSNSADSGENNKESLRTVCLVGQPNCGKSTIFNSFAGYRSVAVNFPGATVNFTKAIVKVGMNRFNLVDLPGTYSLYSSDEAEGCTRDYLLNKKVDLVVVVLDASRLERGLELVLELMEIGKPMVLALNMIDDARKRGMRIDVKKLSDILRIPATETIARQGKGLKRLSEMMLGKTDMTYCYLKFRKDVEKWVSEAAKLVEEAKLKKNIPNRFLATHLLSSDDYVKGMIKKKILEPINRIKEELERSHGQPAESVIFAERHAQSFDIFEKVVSVTDTSKITLSQKIDDIVLHPIFGPPSAMLMLLATFFMIFYGGMPFENLLDEATVWVGRQVYGTLPHGLLFYILKGLVSGINSVMVISLPYLIPFFILFALLEDSGFLVRVAYLTDGIMHKMGLHGVASFPILSGYGCSVPAVMATRILPSRRDRIIASFIAVIVPCSARTTVIIGLIGYFLGAAAAISFYIFNIIVVGVAGSLLSKIWPGRQPEMILEIPPWRVPVIKHIAAKTYFRMKEFFSMASPILVGSSIILALLQYFDAAGFVNNLLSPLTYWTLGLPVAVGIPLIFGILRKEMTLLLLAQSFGVYSISAVHSYMSYSQMVVFVMFILFYTPCAATLGTLAKELKSVKTTALIASVTSLAAALLAFITRIALSVFL